MNVKQTFLPISLVLAASIVSACTHYVIQDPQNPANEQAEKTNPAHKDSNFIKVANGQESTTPTMNGQPANMNPAMMNNAAHMDCNPTQAMNQYINDEGKKVESIMIRVSGYGAPPKAFYPEPQRRLMAMRAAKIDAYRNLAERVHGVKIWGGTTIGDMVVEKDRFRVYLDTHLSGAKVIAENPMEDGTFETTVEFGIDQGFIKNAGLQTVSNNPCNNPGQPSPVRHTRDNPGSQAMIPVSTVTSTQGDFYFGK